MSSELAANVPQLARRTVRPLAPWSADADNAVLAADSNLRKLLRRLADALIDWLEHLLAAGRQFTPPFACG
ncbi:MAG: hypothetical protein HY287_05700 [Planctomycetes bacterium]|nr:hypothetical protein [Planctomycetota bacterium]MBI3833805.1 hypothetical protein [Planctomycetota bacterium]